MRAAITLGIIVLIIIAGCTTGNVVKEPEPIKIGITTTLSGFAAHWGREVTRGTEMAANEINANGGINGRSIKIIYEDFREIDLKAAAAGAQKLTVVDNVDILMTQWTEDTEVVLPIAEATNTPLITFASGAEGLTARSPLLFRTGRTRADTAKMVDQHAFDQGKRNPVILYSSNSYHVNMKDHDVQWWSEKTGNKPDTFLVTDKDVRTSLLKVQSGNYDLLIMRALVPIQVAIMKEAKELGVELMVLGDEGFDPQFLAVPETSEGMYFAEYFIGTEEFDDKYRELYDTEPENPADLCYDTIMIVAKAMREHGTSTEDIVAGLHTIENYEGASGTITLDKTGDRTFREAALYVWKDNEPSRTFSGNN